MPGVHCLYAITISTVAALATYPALRARPSLRIGAAVVAAVVISLSPLLVPADFRVGRFFSALIAVVLLVKLFDLQIHVHRNGRPRLGAFLAFLPTIHTVVLRQAHDERLVDRRAAAGQLTLSVHATAVATLATTAVFRRDWAHYPFAVEHTVKVVAFFCTLLAVAATADAVWRVLGLPVRSLMDRPLLARTPAEFWRRWNRPAQQFFLEDVFKPAGGRGNLMRGLVAAFAVSAVVHEYLFDIAAGRVQGYQTLFFAMHGAAVAATIRVRPPRGYAVPCALATIAFNVAVSVIFFLSVNEILPFYQERSP